MKRYELIVIGSGPAGEKAAVKAAYFGHRVALVEKASLYGGAGVVTGTLPSKTLKETALYLSGKYDKGLYGIDRDLAGQATVEHFMYRKNYVIKSESEEVHANLLRHKVNLYHGKARFLDSHQILVEGPTEETLYGDFILIATGSYPFHPPHIPFDSIRVHDSDTILEITHFPRSIVVSGAGVIGCEYATIFSTMGAKVFLINRTQNILSFIDQQIVRLLLEQMRRDHIELLFDAEITEIQTPNSLQAPLLIKLNSGTELKADLFLFAAGRNGNIEGLGLEKLGIECTKRQTIVVNERYQTAVPHIYAVGDVIGFPALASTSMDQGRIAVAHMFNTQDLEQLATVFPYGIYTVPEISTAGLTEEEARERSLDYVIGVASHSLLPRGKIMGAEQGMLKLVATRHDRRVRGVHIIGPLATELIHQGVEFIKAEKTLLEVIGKVYNFPTLHDLYKYAAYDALGNLAGHKIKS